MRKRDVFGKYLLLFGHWTGRKDIVVLTKPAAGTLGVGQWSSKWGPGASLGVQVGGLGVPNRADEGTPRDARWSESIFSVFSHVGGRGFSILV